MNLTFLGTGANGGVPQLDCRCPNCETATKDRGLIRKRSSLFVEKADKKILIDCGPDFWSQLQDVDLKIPDLDLIVITHLHFDHCNGLMELSGGKKWNVPVLVSEVNRAKLMAGSWSFLEKQGYITFIDSNHAKKMGVSLVEVPHDPNFPTSAVIIEESDKKIWYSSDVEVITESMKKEMALASLIIFDATFWNESVFPAQKMHHLTIEKSLPFFVELGVKTIYTHINHSEDIDKIDRVLDKVGFCLAKDGMEVSISSKC
ncbi:MBL fold metallo-hydrolase [bacterium]|nr:MAG: MBL fold metallo-hydrolase [bacterium]